MAKVWDGKVGKDGIVSLSAPAIAALRGLLRERSAQSSQTKARSNMCFWAAAGGGAHQAQNLLPRPRHREGCARQADLATFLAPTAPMEGGADIREEMPGRRDHGKNLIGKA